MQVPIISGIYATGQELRNSYPRNMVPTPKDTGLSNGYLRPADGIVSQGAGPGFDRGGINWNGAYYRVMGTKLVSISADGVVSEIGDVGYGDQVSFDYSFDRLAICAGGKLFYLTDGSLAQVTDPDLGLSIDVLWIDGYFLSTDGANLVVTELNDPFSVNPLKYGSSEIDPDPVVGVAKVHGEAWAVNRYTIEAFRNVGGSLFPFQRIDGATIERGAVGTHAFANMLETLVYVGSGRNESPAVWLAGAGTAQKISTQEIDTVLQGYTEAQLSAIVVESRVDKGHQHMLIHLPDQTLVYDFAASAAFKASAWLTLDSGLESPSQYRARNLVWCYDKWLVGDPTSTTVGYLSNTVSSHYGEVIGWEFGTNVLYNAGKGGIVHGMELVGLPNPVFGAVPTVWTSYSLDGKQWSQEKARTSGRFGATTRRLLWRRQGKMGNWRIQRFRGTSDCQMSFARLEMEVEALNA